MADSERKDTHPDIERRTRAILLAKTPEERLRMASAMSVGARAMAHAGVRAQLGPDASDREVRRLVFVRFYGRELGKARAEAIFDAIEAKRAAALGV